MALDIAAVRTALAQQITAYVAPCSPYIPEKLGAFPCAFLSLEGVDYDGSFGGANPNVTMSVTVVVGPQMQVEAQKVLDRFMSESGADSVVAAVLTDSTLDGTVDAARVTAAAAPGRVQFGESEYPAVTFSVDIYA